MLEIAENYERIAQRVEERERENRMSLRDAVKSAGGARAFAQGLYDFLHRPEDLETGFNAWCEVVAGLPRRQTRVLTWPVVTVLGIAVLAMAADGFNSFLLDLRHWHPYQPHNWLRVVTGVGAGIALGVTLAYLIGAALWSDPGMNTPVAGWREIGYASIGASVFGGVLLLDWAPLYPMIALLLVATAVGTICTIAYLMLVLVRGTNNRHRGFGDLRVEGAVGIVLGFLIVASLACGRFALERWLGIPITIS